MIEFLGQLYQDYPVVVIGAVVVMMAALVGAVAGVVMAGVIVSGRTRRAITGGLEGVVEALSGKLDTVGRELAELGARVGALEDRLPAGGNPNTDVRFEVPDGADEGQPAGPALDEARQALADGRMESAEALFREVLDRGAAEGEAAYGRAATAARHLGDMAYASDPEKALAAYRQAVILDPGNPEGWNMAGLLLQRAGDLDEARQAFERVRELGAKSGNKRVVAAATGNLGLIAQEKGDWERAETHLLESLALHEELAMDEGIAAASGNLGALYNQRGEGARACSHWARAVGLYEELGAAAMVEKIKERMGDAGCGADGGPAAESVCEAELLDHAVPVPEPNSGEPILGSEINYQENKWTLDTRHGIW